MDEKHLIKYGKGIKVKGIQLRVYKRESKVKPTEVSKPFLRYGEPTGYVIVDNQKELDYHIKPTESIRTKDILDTYQAAENLLEESDFDAEDKAWLQFSLENSEGVEFTLNTGIKKEDFWMAGYDEINNTLNNYSTWCAVGKESTSGVG